MTPADWKVILQLHRKIANSHLKGHRNDGYSHCRFRNLLDRGLHSVRSDAGCEDMRRELSEGGREETVPEIEM
jgi:hypothetical protein